MAKKTSFPDVLYVTIDNPGTKDEILLAWDSLNSTNPRLDEVLPIGVYELVDQKKVTARVEEV